MPTYVYKFVKTGETIEVQQGFDEATLTAVAHPSSGRKMAVKKVFTPVGVTFRGDGFYKTDSRASKKASSKSTDAGTADSAGTDGGAKETADAAAATKDSTTTSDGKTTTDKKPAPKVPERATSKSASSTTP